MISAENPIEGIIFPQYRKYKNGKSFFKILSLNEFEEKYFVGSRGFGRRFKAEIFPDKNFIRDLLFSYDEFAVKIDAREYDSITVEF